MVNRKERRKARKKALEDSAFSGNDAHPECGEMFATVGEAEESRKKTLKKGLLSFLKRSVGKKE